MYQMKGGTVEWVCNLEPVTVGKKDGGTLQRTLSSQQEGSYHVLQVIAVKCRVQKSGQQVWQMQIRNRTYC